MKMARVHPGHFNSYVLQDEQTGLPIECNQTHFEWADLLTRHKRCLIWGHVESGKSQQISIGRTLWELGRNPNTRVVVVSNTDSQAQAIVSTCARYIEGSERLHRVFPNLRRAKGQAWTRHALTVERVGTPTHPSLRSCGIHGNILGARIDRLILDDILDYENTTSETQRKDLQSWYSSTLGGRLTADASVWCVGNAWNVDDMLHQWAKTNTWACYRYPVISASGRLNWPERWSRERIERWKEEYGPLEFARQLLCVARSDEDSRFKRDWVYGCLLEMDGGEHMVWALQEIPAGCRTFTGVDLSTGKARDLTVLFTIMVRPNGSRLVLSCESGKWGADEILANIKSAHERYRSIAIVENNAAQDYIVQMLRGQTSVPVIPYTTGAKVHRSPDFGIESMAVEFSNGKWEIPCGTGGRIHPELSAWMGEMLYYDPDGHPGDRLMASWFAREGASNPKKRGRVGRLDLVTR